MGKFKNVVLICVKEGLTFKDADRPGVSPPVCGNCYFLDNDVTSEDTPDPCASCSPGGLNLYFEKDTPTPTPTPEEVEAKLEPLLQKAKELGYTPTEEEVVGFCSGCHVVLDEDAVSALCSGCLVDYNVIFKKVGQPEPARLVFPLSKEVTECSGCSFFRKGYSGFACFLLRSSPYYDPDRHGTYCPSEGVRRDCPLKNLKELICE